MNRLIELRLKQQALQKKMDAIEAELDLVFHQIDDEMERQLDDEQTVLKSECECEDGILINKKDLHKLLCLLEHSIISKESVPSQKDRYDLMDFRESLSWDIAEMYNYDLNEGSINPNTYQFEKFTYDE